MLACYLQANSFVRCLVLYNLFFCLNRKWCRFVTYFLSVNLMDANGQYCSTSSTCRVAL